MPWEEPTAEQPASPLGLNQDQRVRDEVDLTATMPDPPWQRLVELMQIAERNGFDYGWTYDSHVLWQESFPLLTLAAQATTTMKLGHCVTNPGTREPTVLASGYATLHDISDGPMVMGIGRGDSARRVLGKAPTSMKELEQAVHVIRALVEGRRPSQGRDLG